MPCSEFSTRIVFDLKTARREKLVIREADQEEPAVEQKDLVPPPEKAVQKSSGKVAQPSNSPELRTRISNAVKATKSLGGEADDIDRGDATDEELQFELEELTNQYKRLKNSKGSTNKR